MRVVSRVLLALLLAVALLAGAAGPVGASDDAPLNSTAVAASQAEAQTEPADTLNVTQEFQLAPTRPGEVLIRLRYDVPSPVVAVRTSIPGDARVINTDGFGPGPGGQYHWDESTTDPTLTYLLQVNESLADDTPHGASGSKTSVDAGSWAMFQRPSTNTRYDHTGPVNYDVHRTTDGPGETGEWMVFLGEHELHERSAHGQNFRFVVPENANTSDPPEAILDSLTRAAGSLQVGGRHDDVFVVAAPTEGVTWGVRGAHVGDSDMWVRDAESLDNPDNAWLHEYVHSRQGYTLDAEMRWFHEASATYFASLLAFEHGHVEYDGFEDRLAAGNQSAYDDVVLANQSTWERHADYDRGALIAADIDRRIRLASGGNRSLQSVFQAMNEPPERTSLADFEAHVAEYGNESVAETSVEHATTTTNVSTWNESVHVSSHGPYPPNVSYQFPEANGSDQHRVTGPYRSSTVTQGDPIVVVPGEQLSVAVDVTNTGGTRGAYNATLLVNDSVSDVEAGMVEVDETTTAHLDHTFRSTGSHELLVGEDRMDVFVTDPADVEFGSFSATTRRVSQGETVPVTGTVSNDASIPANGSLTISRNGEPVVTEMVRLEPGRSETVFYSVPVQAPGETVLEFNGQEPITVDVDETETATNGSDSAGSSSTATPTRTATTPSTPGPNSTASATPETNESVTVPGVSSTWLGGGTAVLVILVTVGLFVRLRT